MRTILVAEDDRSFRDGLATALTGEGFEVTAVDNGPKAVQCVTYDKPDVVILDVMLPGESGLSVCRTLRQREPDLPIVLMSCRRTDELDRVCGFEGGADDYLIKPFGMRELVARINARLRRASPALARTCTFSDVRIDFATKIVTRCGKRVLLTRMEYDLLAHLADCRGQIISREELLRVVWGHTKPTHTRTVDTHILALRKKLERDPEHPVHLRSVRGIGYHFL